MEGLNFSDEDSEYIKELLDDPEMCYTIGVIYNNKDDWDYDRSYTSHIQFWIEKAAKNADPLLLYELGRVLFAVHKRDRFGCDDNYFGARAYELCRDAALRGNKRAQETVINKESKFDTRYVELYKKPENYKKCEDKNQLEKYKSDSGIHFYCWDFSDESDDDE